MIKSRCLVTGASGFIGRVLCQRLKGEGSYVTALTRRSIADGGPWDEEVAIDLAEDTPGIHLLRGVDVVFHLAGKAHALSESAEEESKYQLVNVDGTRKLLQAAKAAGVKRFVFFSSVKAMGEGGKECLDESAACRPVMAYGRSKFLAERLVLEGGYVDEPVVLRLAMVYGPTNKGNLPRMIHAIGKGYFPPVPETGNKRSMVHVDDVVQAALLAAERPEARNDVFIVSDKQAYSTRQMYEWICEALHKRIPIWHVPMAALELLARIGDGIGTLRKRRFFFDSVAMEKLMGNSWYSPRKIERELGFEAQRNLRASLPEIIRFLDLC